MSKRAKPEPKLDTNKLPDIQPDPSTPGQDPPRAGADAGNNMLQSQQKHLAALERLFRPS